MKSCDIMGLKKGGDTMGYGTHTRIGKLDDIVLDKNISTIVDRINNRQTTIEDEISKREHEVEVLNNMSCKSTKVKKHNKYRIEYIEKEIYILKRLKL